MNVFDLIVKGFSILASGVVIAVLIAGGLFALYDLLQTKHAIRRNFPIIGIFRYALEKVGPELRQYLFSDDRGERPVPRYIRAWIYASAKNELSTVAFGTKKDVDKPGTILIRHSAYPLNEEKNTCERIWVGKGTCEKPYEASLFNISAMSFGALGKNAVLALSMGAKEGGFMMNTGEGGLSPHHLKGGADLCWQIGTAKFSCRTPDGDFSMGLFKEKASLPQVKMVEIKLSQGAKPGKGGVLPKAKITPEIAAIRGVPPDRDVFSPPRHKEWDCPEGMLEWIAGVKEACGKPVGIKFCVGRPDDVDGLCDAIVTTGICPDFITVDGAEGGTGAAPMAHTDLIGYPLHDGLMLVDNALRSRGLRDRLRLIASGKVFTGGHLAIALALGADMANSARGFMMSVGCIHALKCNTNHCPAGVATHSPWLQRGLVPEVKAPRVPNYHRAVLHELNLTLHSCGYSHTGQLSRKDVMKVIGHNRIVSFAELVPYPGGAMAGAAAH